MSQYTGTRNRIYKKWATTRQKVVTTNRTEDRHSKQLVSQDQMTGQKVVTGQETG